MTEKLSDYEYSILDEIRRDEINQAIEKAEKYDKIKDESLILNPDLLEQNKSLSDENKMFRDKINELEAESAKRGLIIGDKDEQIVRLKERGVFVKCKLPECFPEHKYIEKDNIFYCEKLTNIGEVNWD
ncbi:MAG: hypothetical protein AABY15_03965 [Nanoarchaeota archaeon]